MNSGLSGKKRGAIGLLLKDPEVGYLSSCACWSDLGFLSDVVQALPRGGTQDFFYLQIKVSCATNENKNIAFLSDNPE